MLDYALYVYCDSNNASLASLTMFGLWVACRGIFDGGRYLEAKQVVQFW